MPLRFLCLVKRLSRLSDEDDDSDDSDDDEHGDDDDNNEYNGGSGCGDDCVDADGGDGAADASGGVGTGGKSIPMISIQLWLLFSLNDKFEAALQPPDDDDGNGADNTVDDVDVTIGGTIVSGTRWGVRLEIGGSIGLVGHWYDGVVADGTLLKK